MTMTSVQINSLHTLGYALSQTFVIDDAVVASVVQQTTLAPVQCIDCETYVPFGWVEFGTVRCPKNIGGNGVQYGHRVPREVYESVLSVAFNKVASDPTIAERA